jgi:hypothetical protein
LAFSKIVKAYQKALKDIGRQDVTIAFGSWGWKFIPVAGLFMPENCPFIPLDNENTLDPGEAKKFLNEDGSKRKIIPILWAQDDDHRYMGKPLTPNTNFNDLLKQCNASGFGIIHWTTRPLDLFFKSLAEQVWNTSVNKSLALTVADYSQKVFGRQQDVMNEYLTGWIENGPMFGRETTDHFFDLPNKKPLINDEPINTTIERINNRIGLLKKADPSKMPEFGRKMFNYDYSSEIFYLSLYQNQNQFYKAYAMLERQCLDSAKAILQTVTPEKTIELYSDASAKLPITAGEKALIVSMGTRWLPDFINLKQRARMADIRYKFGATQHDSLAQQPGAFTYFIDEDKNYWSCLGETELKAGTAGNFDNKEAAKYPENSLTYIKITAPFSIPLVTFGRNTLEPGKYSVEIKYMASGDGSGCKLYLTAKNNRIPIQTILQDSGTGLNVISSTIEIKDLQKSSIEIDPGNGAKFFANLVIKPI